MSCRVFHSDAPDQKITSAEQYGALLSLLKRITFTCKCLTQQTNYVHQQVKIIKSKLTNQKISSWGTIDFVKVNEKLDFLNSWFLGIRGHKNGAKVLFHRKISDLKMSKCPEAKEYFSGVPTKR